MTCVRASIAVGNVIDAQRTLLGDVVLAAGQEIVISAPADLRAIVSAMWLG